MRVKTRVARWADQAGWVMGQNGMSKRVVLLVGRIALAQTPFCHINRFLSTITKPIYCSFYSFMILLNKITYNTVSITYTFDQFCMLK